MNTESKKKQPVYWLRQEFLRVKTKKETGAYLYIVFTLFSVSFFGFFILRPAISTITNLQKKLEDNKSVYNALQKKLAALHNLDSEYSQIKPDLPMVYNAIPITPDIPTLTRQVETLASKNQVELRALTVSPLQYYPQDAGGKLYGYTITVEVTGGEQNVNTFIENVTNFQRIISIQKITTGKTDKGQLELSFSGKAYFAKE
ncbi:MAG: type 4a pilus biogenesis protein PilO [Candidatus Levybacteria bacterium]|nr:type 4a pilus biogenesis protein PilO [Candidatus Levybacteria bacterium]MBP9814759.1 type 4a pilus biogenesis protein PilO [Candidatus Levybacteria bacterium]